MKIATKTTVWSSVIALLSSSENENAVAIASVKTSMAWPRSSWSTR